MNTCFRQLRATSLAAVSIAVGAFSPSSFADTILWYRFEDHEAGYVTQIGDEIANSGPNASIVGTAQSSVAGKTPSFVATPQGWEGVYDPVSGKIHPNRTAISLPNTGSGTDESSYPGNGPRIEVPDAEAMHLSSFTIEMFVKRNRNYRPAYESLCGKQCDGGATTRCNFLLYNPAVGDANNTAFQVMIGNGTSRKSSVSSNTLNNDTALRAYTLEKRDFWDHVAITYDDSTKTVNAYVNYVKKGTYGFSNADGFAPLYDPSFPLMIGCGPANWARSFCGCIDEFRLSSGALAPSQFLRLCSPNALPETVNYVDFSAATNLTIHQVSSQSYTATRRGNFANSAPIMGARCQGAELKTRSLGSGRYIVDDDIPAATMRGGLLAADFAYNLAAAHLATNSAKLSYSGNVYIYPGAQWSYSALSDTSVTVEFFFKAGRVENVGTHTNNYDDAYIFRMHPLEAKFVRGNGKENVGSILFHSLNAQGKAEPDEFIRFDDDAWHHFAYVFDKSEGREVFYIDGRRMFGRRSESFKTSHAFEADMILGSGDFMTINAHSTLPEAMFDEIRITKKALRPCEFLTTAPREDGVTLAWYSFEGNSLDNGVYPDAIGSGNLSAYAGGTPAFSSLTPGSANELHDIAKTKIRDNATSLSFAGGKAVWPRNSLLEREDLTVEFFARQRTASAGAGLVSLLRSATGTNSTSIAEADAIWSIRLGADGLTPEVYAHNGSAQTVAFPSSAALGRRWRHYAVSFVPDGDNMTLKLYCDQTLVKTDAITGALQLPGVNSGAIPMLGATSGSGGVAFNGLIDEVRMSLGEVAEADFLYAPPPGGTTIFMR